MAQAIYIVEDESIVALDIAARIKRLGFAVAGTAGTAEMAVEQLATIAADLVLMDVQLRGPMDGIQAAEIVRARYDIPVVFLTAYSDDHSLERAAKTHAYGYLLKPFQERELLIAVQMALSKHETERHLSRTRSLMDTTLNTLDVGVITTDAAANVQLMNSAAARILGWNQTEVLGKPLAHFFVGESEPSEGVSDGVEWVRLAAKDGSRIPVELRRRHWQERADQTAPTGEVLVIRDITQLREYQRNLVVAKEAAEAATRAKSEFLSNMSHELRTPLNSIVGMAALIREHISDPKVNELLDILRTSADSLLELVNDVLDFSKVDSRTVSVKHELFSLSRIIEETVQTHRTAARAKRLTLAVAVDPTVPAQLYGDGGRIAQILRNLLSNAIKFTEDGYVFVEAWCEPANPVEERRVNAHILVHDTGIGIAQDQHERIFETFTQLDGSSRRSAGGTGLGLSIVQRLTELMNGAIQVHSQPNQGSTFRVVIPFSTSTTDTRSICESAGNLSRVIAESGLAARLAHRLLPQIPCTVVSDETEFTKARIGDTERDRGVVWMRIGERDQLHLFRGHDRGLTPYSLSLPFNGESFCRLIATDDLMTPRAAGTSATEMNAVATAHRPLGSVLLVDDNAINRRVSAALVEQCGFLVEDCGTAAEALIRCRERAFDLCLIDIRMPGMDGFELLAKLRDLSVYPQLRDTAFVACTAHADAETRTHAVAAGCVGYLPKPYSPAQLELVLHVPATDQELRYPPRSLLDRFTVYLESDRLDQLADLARLLQSRVPNASLKEHMFRLALAARRQDGVACRTILKIIEGYEGVENAVFDR